MYNLAGVRLSSGFLILPSSFADLPSTLGKIPSSLNKLKLKFQNSLLLRRLTISKFPFLVISVRHEPSLLSLPSGFFLLLSTFKSLHSGSSLLPSTFPYIPTAFIKIPTNSPPTTTNTP
ncbi:hypothetical protein [Bacillus sp. MUM 116]|uniref:hypothetical protein n=1 Tax=Bacillus sp. MUM 116 TaxID=1678002 RepID=UPI00114D46A4|nr:hypothetical protein [Bacillus sp. MUM 116]